MKVVIQRVSRASVSVEGKIVGRIGTGAVIFVGVARTDTEEDAAYLARKVSEIRLFSDKENKMNVGPREACAQFLIISQFTLYGDCRKGRRPSFDKAAPPEKGQAIYERLVELIRKEGFEVETGLFGAMMKVELVNEGPVTFVLESI
ncbi:MAG: D-aminoacyl-tRNA deacylase [Candidatus Omnitrophota bacterium]